MGRETRSEIKTLKYIALTLDETAKLVVCVLLDIAEYAFPVLLSPIVGDILDIAGVGAGVIMFGWIGLLSSLEFLPLVDFFPIFIFTWIVWYYLKKEKEKSELERLKEKWK